ncbi:MAG: hypothetical protein P1U53_04795, partial [Sulfitobacter sp.]|nr:hypothetical protein [Sulfitobacter sp.]
MIARSRPIIAAWARLRHSTFCRWSAYALWQAAEQRPCAERIAHLTHSETVVFILLITTQPPLPSRKFIEVPQIESQRVGLETH